MKRRKQKIQYNVKIGKNSVDIYAVVSPFEYIFLNNDRIYSGIANNISDALDEYIKDAGEDRTVTIYAMCNMFGRWFKRKTHTWKETMLNMVLRVIRENYRRSIPAVIKIRTKQMRDILKKGENDGTNEK